jgi:hypothetical protein
MAETLKIRLELEYSRNNQKEWMLTSFSITCKCSAAIDSSTVLGTHIFCSFIRNYLYQMCFYRIAFVVKQCMTILFIYIYKYKYEYDSEFVNVKHKKEGNKDNTRTDLREIR